MSLAHPQQTRGSQFHGDRRSSCARNNMFMMASATATAYFWNYGSHDYVTKFGAHNNDDCLNFTQSHRPNGVSYDCHRPDYEPSSKRRKTSAFSCEGTGLLYQQQNQYLNCPVNRIDLCKPSKCNARLNSQLVCNSSTAVADQAAGSTLYDLSTSRCDLSKFENDKVVFMSRNEIENCSPSRKDGIDHIHETYLRHSYCSFLQNVGSRLHLPQATIGTAMVLCHRFFLHCSHVSHDRFLIATAVLFLTSKSEETPCALNDILRVSCEILQKQDFWLLSYMLPIDWFEKYRERITDAEQLVLTTLNFELNVQHPYESLTSTLQKIGFAHSLLVNMALNFISEGLRSSLWLQFKPHQIAAGAAYLAAKFLKMNLSSCDSTWHEFHTPPTVLRDVAHQLMELF